ncbi:MAG: cytochrome P450 [Isosphaeraceae bacterium]|jgi:cytochrome P450
MGCSTGDAPSVGDWETVGRRGRAGQETPPKPAQQIRWERGYAYFPFGGGPRICIGNNFALLESSLLLATIARRFRLRLAPDAVVTPLPSMTLRPAHGVKVVVTQRR